MSEPLPIAFQATVDELIKIRELLEVVAAPPAEEKRPSKKTDRRETRRMGYSMHAMRRDVRRSPPQILQEARAEQ